MEEDEYKSTYNDLTPIRCVFEKALVNYQANHQIKCSLSRHFCLADREGYSCDNASSSAKCGELLEKLREKSIFVLKLHDIDGPLPHNMEIRVQAGGLTGLSKLLNVDSVDQAADQPAVADINQLLAAVQEKYGSFDKMPFSEIIQSVVQFQGRRRRQR